MKRCPLLALFCLAVWGQQPDITQSLTLTTTGIGTPIFAGSGPANGAIAWRLIYSVDGTLFTAAQLAIQGANAPTAQACAALTAGDFTTITGSVPGTLVESSNPPASGAQGTVAVKAYYSCIVARVLSVTGASGTVKTTLSGWRTSFAFPQTGSFGLADSRNVDSFGRLRTGAPATLFESQTHYDTNPLLWDTVLTAGGTAAVNQNQAAVVLTVSANGDKVVRESHGYIPYEPGKSQAVVFTAVMGAIKAGTRQRIGYFDDQNGAFFEQNGSTLRVVQRSYVSGAAVDTAVEQSAWNLDKMDGTGPSGIVLDTSKANIYWILP